MDTGFLLKTSNSLLRFGIKKILAAFYNLLKSKISKKIKEEIKELLQTDEDIDIDNEDFLIEKEANIDEEEKDRWSFSEILERYQQIVKKICEENKTLLTKINFFKIFFNVDSKDLEIIASDVSDDDFLKNFATEMLLNFALLQPKKEVIINSEGKDESQLYLLPFLFRSRENNFSLSQFQTVALSNTNMADLTLYFQFKPPVNNFFIN
jgi:hypothetical protein